MEIASQAEVEKRAVIQYIIEGIDDDATNKSLLYGATSIKQLKERFCQYENMIREMQGKAKSAERKGDGKSFQKKPATVIEYAKPKRCFNCGETNHISAECPEKQKGVKCFKCNEFGHIASKCPPKSEGTIKEINVVSRQGEQNYMKAVLIGQNKFAALVDTGSDLTFMRTDEYVKIGSPALRDRKANRLYLKLKTKSTKIQRKKKAGEEEDEADEEEDKADEDEADEEENEQFV
ncbi:unnamed protein product [Brassicogethes aeneus]|uniref:CCHC-type domain-containing protein n=1 Tax=Brassicogethes aeneus TaxID=1431903 RepID=A0A9P0FH37_BRAAE|nr:unnamed protein product [Brassicogethes aeneus]